MEDKQIVELYFARSETAIAETDKKYGRYFYSIAYNILRSNEDAEECVNDTYVKAWDIMPPQKPNRLMAFLGRITRNISLNRYDHELAAKRHAESEAIFSEVAEFIPAPDSESHISEEIALRDAINGFLASLSERTRTVFVQRYWYMCSVKEISQSVGITETNVKVILHRTRADFKAYLEKEGITV